MPIKAINAAKTTKVFICTIVGAKTVMHHSVTLARSLQLQTIVNLQVRQVDV